MRVSKYTEAEKIERRKIARKKYAQSEKGKMTAKRHSLTDKFKETQKKYLTTEKGSNKKKELNQIYQKTETRKEYYKNYRNSNRDKFKFWKSRRRALEKNAFCSDSDSIAIKRIYRISNILTEKSGKIYHVDHILPISKGGIHHEDNLQIIEASINTSKNNSLTFRHPNIKHWTELPQYLLDMIDPNKLKQAFDELQSI